METFLLNRNGGGHVVDHERLEREYVKRGLLWDGEWHIQNEKKGMERPKRPISSPTAMCSGVPDLRGIEYSACDVD
jgi:hypothetical protein